MSGEPRQGWPAGPGRRPDLDIRQARSYAQPLRGTQAGSHRASDGDGAKVGTAPVNRQSPSALWRTNLWGVRALLLATCVVEWPCA